VDDEPLLLGLFGAWLRRTGAGRLHTAQNGEAALAAMKEELFDILVTDIRMPVMDGVTLVRSLAAAGISVPVIIFVSGFGDIDVREMYSLGVEAFLSKPVLRDELISVLKRAVVERSALWSEAMPTKPRQSLESHLARIDVGPDAPFCLGRGGFSVRSLKPLSLGKISFRFTFESLQWQIVGEGYVRWYSRVTQTAGIEFAYLDLTCRSSVVDIISATKPRSFIPDCS